MSRRHSFLLLVPRASLPSLLNAVSRRADGRSSLWLPFEEAYREVATHTRHANGREEGSIGKLGIRVKRGIFNALMNIDSPTSSISEMFEESALVRAEMLAIVREAGGGVAILAHDPSIGSYERLDRPGHPLDIEVDPSSVDAFTDAVRAYVTV